MYGTSKAPLNPEQAIARLRKLCVRREMCCFEAHRKLGSWGLSSTEQERILNALVEDRFIDDQRFAIAFTRDKSRFDRWGKVKIRYALQERRIPAEYISVALEEVTDVSEDANLEKLLLRKLQSLKSESGLQDKRNKLIRFGLSRGYEMRHILDALRKLSLQ